MQPVVPEWQQQYLGAFFSGHFRRGRPSAPACKLGGHYGVAREEEAARRRMLSVTLRAGLVEFHRAELASGICRSDPTKSAQPKNKPWEQPTPLRIKHAKQHPIAIRRRSGFPQPQFTICLQPTARGGQTAMNNLIVAGKGGLGRLNRARPQECDAY